MENPIEKERIAKVETEVKNISTELAGIWKVLNQIQDSLNKSNKTDWQTIFAGLLLVGALYAAAIHPISNDVERTAKSADALAQAVIVQNDMFSDEKFGRQHNEDELDKRVSIIEFRLNKATN